MFLGNLSHLHALKGVGNRAFYRWLTRDYRALFPQLPERTRLFRLFKTHQDWTQIFLVVLGRNNPSPYTVNGRPLYVHLNGLAIV